MGVCIIREWGLARIEVLYGILSVFMWRPISESKAYRFSPETNEYSYPGHWAGRGIFTAHVVKDTEIAGGGGSFSFVPGG